MEYLLDTHILIWYMSNDKKLSKEVREIIMNKENTIYYSTINLWEMVLKSEKEKVINYKTINDFNVNIIESGLLPLSIYPRHIYALEQLTIINKDIKHKDPFDRMLIAQAKENKMFLLTHDDSLKQYKEKCVKII